MLYKFLSSLMPVHLKRTIFNRFRQEISHTIGFTKVNFSPARTFPSPYDQIYESADLLQQLGEKYQPTKRLHNYLPYYWRHFRDIRTRVKRVLEIGLQTDRSIKMWEEFFPNAIIYGIDIDENCQDFGGGRRRVFIGSQTDKQFLDKVILDAGGAFDVIIDDGSHYVDHQLKSFDFLFPSLTDHGIYVIEDTGACVRDYKMKTVSAIAKLLRHIYYPTANIGVENVANLASFPVAATWADRNIRGISFYRWICFIERGHNPSDNPFLRNG